MFGDFHLGAEIDLVDNRGETRIEGLFALLGEQSHQALEIAAGDGPGNQSQANPAQVTESERLEGPFKGVANYVFHR